MDEVELNNELEKITALFHDKKIDTEKLREKGITRHWVNDNFNNIKDQALLVIQKRLMICCQLQS